jgi:hypothetical protein
MALVVVLLLGLMVYAFTCLALWAGYLAVARVARYVRHRFGAGHVSLPPH